MTEWLDIPGYEGLYRINENGEVLSCARLSRNGRRIKERILKPGGVGHRKYPAVMLYSRDGRVKVRKIGHLVALAFIGPWPVDAECVRHLDDDQDNSHLDNLVYGTIVENYQDSVRHGRAAKGEKSGRAKLTALQVSVIKRRLLEGARARDLAKEYGVTASVISVIKNEAGWLEVKPAPEGWRATVE